MRKDDRKFILFEYEKKEAINNIYKGAAFKSSATPWPNQFLKIHSTKLQNTANQSIDTPIKQGTTQKSSILSILQAAETVDEQILLLYKHLSINDLSIRLKYLATRQAQNILNQCLSNEFPQAVIYPFGSSLSGFGKMGCDLDMALKFKNRDFSGDQDRSRPFEFSGKLVEKDGTRKEFEGRQVKYIASVFDHFLPGSAGVESFHNARVPIVRYFDKNVRSCVDISANNP